MLDAEIDVEPWTDHLMLLSGFLWLAVLVLGLTGHWFEGLLVSTFLFHPWFVIGASHDQKISAKLLVYPLGLWTVFELAAFVLTEYYATAFGSQAPEFLVTGLHPSFAAAYWLYWVGGFLTVTLAYGIYFRKHFMPEGEWDRFLERVEEDQADEQGEEPEEQRAEVA